MLPCARSPRRLGGGPRLATRRACARHDGPVDLRPTFADLVESLTRVLASGEPTEHDRLVAREHLRAIGIDRLVGDLALAERILLAGEGFHSIERFFVDGSDEQRFLVELIERSRTPPEG